MSISRRALLTVAAGTLVSGVLRATDPGAAPRRWPYERQSDVFFVHADFDVDRYDPGLIGSISGLKPVLQRTLGIEIYDETVHLVLFAQQTRFREYLQQYFPTVPYRQALFVKNRGPGTVFAFASESLLSDLRHEATHGLLNASLPYVPLWLDEGLAEYFEPATDSPGSHIPQEHQITLRAILGQAPSIERLESIDSLEALGAREYREAWSIVHFLLHSGDRNRAVLREFLQDLQAHNPPGQFSRRLARAVPDWQSQYVAHFRPSLALLGGD